MQARYRHHSTHGTCVSRNSNQQNVGLTAARGHFVAIAAAAAAVAVAVAVASFWYICCESWASVRSSILIGALPPNSSCAGHRCQKLCAVQQKLSKVVCCAAHTQKKRSVLRCELSTSIAYEMFDSVRSYWYW